ncbi:MAG TPA: fused response regulator/phosphatase, partial [Thermoanaerobaculia bacterium]|nr:fused response regulator/phosphatase [Thermoanaerobaculia bacterium]
FLERRGFDVAPAQSGEEGLALASSIIPDAFVIDYRMPVMDGFEVTRRIKSDPQLKTIPVLMLTGADSAQHVVDGLGAGADEFVAKGSETEVLLARLLALLRVKEYEDELRRMNQQMTRDLQIARRVQEALVPRGSFATSTVEIRSGYIPSAALSGDFYDYFLQDGSLYIFVADVSGHGLPAAILVSLLKSYIHTEATAERSLAEVMAQLNDFLFSVSLPTQFATAQLFRINTGGKLVYANAAHPAFLLYSHEQQRTQAYEHPSNLLGAMPGMTFEEQALTLFPGDTLFIYTDGLSDMRNAAGEFYSIDRIVALLEESRDDDIGALHERIYDDVHGFSAVEEFRDDIAFVLARLK